MRFRCADAVSQILDYAKEISRWSYEQLNDAVRRATKRPENTNALFDLVQKQNDTIDEQTFVDDVTRNLKSGRFLLLVVGDGIREGVERIDAALPARRRGLSGSRRQARSWRDGKEGQPLLDVARRRGRQEAKDCRCAQAIR